MVDDKFIKTVFSSWLFATSTAFLKAYELAKELQYLILTASTSLFFFKNKFTYAK